MGWKIVRDNQPEWSQRHGVSGQWRTCQDPVASLRKKLLEEAGEYWERGEPGELYDLRDVIQALIGLEDPLHDHREAHLRKVQRLGKFARLIEWTPVPAGHAGEEVP